MPGAVPSSAVGLVARESPTTEAQPAAVSTATLASTPTGAYCGNASFLILFAKIKMSFGTGTTGASRTSRTSRTVNVTAKVDSLNVVKCPYEPFVYHPASGNVNLTNLVRTVETFQQH